jgi:hypothetical protein
MAQSERRNTEMIREKVMKIASTLAVFALALALMPTLVSSMVTLLGR